MADSAEPWFWTRRFTTTLALPTRFLSRNKNLLNPPVLFIIIIHNLLVAKFFCPVLIIFLGDKTTSPIFYNPAFRYWQTSDRKTPKQCGPPKKRITFDLKKVFVGAAG